MNLAVWVCAPATQVVCHLLAHAGLSPAVTNADRVHPGDDLDERTHIWVQGLREICHPHRTPECVGPTPQPACTLSSGSTVIRGW